MFFLWIEMTCGLVGGCKVSEEQAVSIFMDSATLRHDPEQHHHLHRCENLESRI